jgi:uncharacterized protein (TIGR02466 family)
MQINNWFSTPFFHYSDTSNLSLANSLFEIYKDNFFHVNNNLHTTLKQYDPYWCSESTVDLTKETKPKLIIKMFKYASESFAKKIGYDLTNIDLYVENAWMNIMGKGSVVERHSHGGALFSGCYYVKVPGGSPSVNFYSPLENLGIPKLPIKNHNEITSSCVQFYPVDGDVYIWPANIKHDVLEHNPEETRFVIAFDIKPIWKTT